MFIFRFIRTILWLIGLGTVIYWGWQYFEPQSPLRDKVNELKTSPVVKEGVKDLKTYAGEVFKGVGNKLENEVTDEERRQLDELLRKEIEAGTPKAKREAEEKVKQGGTNAGTGSN